MSVPSANLITGLPDLAGLQLLILTNQSQKPLKIECLEFRGRSSESCRIFFQNTSSELRTWSMDQKQATLMNRRTTRSISRTRAAINAIQHLPSDALLRILELALEDANNQQQTRFKILYSACLINKAFLTVAQPLLWTHLILSDNFTVDLLLSSASFSKFPTASLEIVGYQRMERYKRKRVQRVLAGMRGLKRLRLFRIDEFAALTFDIFSLPNLSELVDLEIVCSTIQMSTPENSTPSFSLQRLKIHNLTSNFPNPYTFFDSPLLNHLEITLSSTDELPGSEAHTNALQLFSSRASQLTSLKGSFVEYLVPFIAQCTNLTSLDIYKSQFLLPIASILPSQLSTLSTGPPFTEDLTKALDLWSLEKLSELGLYSSSLQFLEKGGTEEFLRRAEERGIKVEFLETRANPQ